MARLCDMPLTHVLSRTAEVANDDQDRELNTKVHTHTHTHLREKATKTRLT